MAQDREAQDQAAEVRVAQVVAALPPPLAVWVETLVREAMRAGVALHLVGGPVRDWLLEKPLRDVDLVVAAEDGKKIEAVVRALAGDELRVLKHERFGTLALRGEDELAIDVTTMRSEHYAHPGALPKVEPGSLKEDLARRDFSVNAMALRITADPEDAKTDGAGLFDLRSEIESVPGAAEDLREKRLAVLHARSFHDDPTRALRAARLVPRLGFALSRSTRARLRDALRDGAFGAVSGDRLRREFEKLFADSVLGLDPAAALRKLAEWHVLSALEPGLELPRAAVAPLRSLGRSIADPPWRFARHRPWVSGLCLWLAPTSPGLRRRTLARLSVRGELARRISSFGRARDAWLAQLERARGRGAVDAALSEIDEDTLLALHACAPPTVRRRIVRWAAEDRQRRPSVSGNDLVELGLEGPAIGRVLSRVRAAYLDGSVANREEALALARELARRSKAASKPKRAKKSSRKKADDAKRRPMEKAGD